MFRGDKSTLIRKRGISSAVGGGIGRCGGLAWLLSWLPEGGGAILAVLLIIIIVWRRLALTVGDLVRLSLLLVDEDDGDEDDDLSHNAQEGPEGGQAAAHAQVDFACGRSQLICALAHIVAHVLGDVQRVDVQGGLVRLALDLVPISSVADGLRCTHISHDKNSKTHTNDRQ